MRGQRTLLIALPFRAGLTLGGRLSRPARRSTDVPRRAPGHVPRTIQVGVQPISAALACEGSPRTSGLAAAAPAAVAGRERPRQGLHAHPLSSPLGAHHVLPTPERPGVESSIPRFAGSHFRSDPRESFHGHEGLRELGGPPDQGGGGLVKVRPDTSRLPVLHGPDRVAPARALPRRPRQPAPAPRLVESSCWHPEGPQHPPHKVPSDRDDEVAGDVEVDPNRGLAHACGRYAGGNADGYVEEQLAVSPDQFPVRRAAGPCLPQGACFPCNPQPDRGAAQAHLDPVLIAAREQAQRARDVEPERGDSRPMREAPPPTVLPARLVGCVGLVRCVPAGFRYLRREPTSTAEGVGDESMEIERCRGRCCLACSTQKLSPRRHGPAMNATSRRTLPGFGRFTLNV
jgi:hypothetical protein